MGWIEDTVDSGFRDMARGDKKGKDSPQVLAGVPDILTGAVKVKVAITANPVAAIYHVGKRMNEAREAKAEFHRELTREVVARLERERERS